MPSQHNSGIYVIASFFELYFSVRQRAARRVFELSRQPELARGLAERRVLGRRVEGDGRRAGQEAVQLRRALLPLVGERREGLFEVLIS